VSSNALCVAGQADDVVLFTSHRLLLSHPRDIRDPLGFSRAPHIGNVNVRSAGLGVRAPRRPITPGIKSGRGIRKFAIDQVQLS
jgi:hypothetical protein